VTTPYIASALAGYLKFDEVGWLHVSWKVTQFGRRTDFRRLVLAIAAELERVEVLTAPDLERLMAQDRETAVA
jgi:hypothetical protein